MPSPSQHFGSWAESRAVDFLRAKNYQILARHVTSRYGEIDIVAKHNDIVVIVEVKARRSASRGRALENVTPEKVTRLQKTIGDILQQSYWPEERLRLDVITVEPFGIEHIEAVG